MKMRIKDGNKLKADFATKKDWWTIEAISKGMKMSTRTVGKMIHGEVISHKTAKDAAIALGVDVLSIAEFATPTD